MIKGLTHDQDGNLHKITNYSGKISTGFSPNEKPWNNNNYPMAAGFFRILKNVTKTERVGTTKKQVTTNEWILNEAIQKLIENDLPSPNVTPRRLEIISLYKTIDEMWESSLSLFSASDGLQCKSHGDGTIAKQLKISPDNERSWVERSFDGKPGCQYRLCPDYLALKCKPMGILKCFPKVDMSPNPYRFETRSINSILQIESSLQELYALLKAAHMVKEIESGSKLPFEGFFGMKLYLRHSKKKSGGKDVFVTNILPTEDFTEYVMEPIKRGLASRQKTAKMIGGTGSASMLEAAAYNLLKEEPDVDVDTMGLSDQQDIAINFSGVGSGDAEEIVPEQLSTEPVTEKKADVTTSSSSAASKLLDG